jgi:hypothetical protein
MSKMAIATKTIGELLAAMDANELVLPEIQRDFVWSKRSVRLLFDSLYRQLPIGNMLVWKAKLAVKSKAFGRKSSKPGALLSSFYGYLLDGQQRLTALAKVRDGDEEYKLMFYLWPENDAEALPEHFYYWNRSWMNDNPWWVSVEDVLSPKFKPLEYLKRFAEDEEFIEERHAQKVMDRLGALQRILDYQLGVIEFETSDYREATEVFIRFNSTGKKLSKSDLAMAELATRISGLPEEMTISTRKWEPAFRFTRPFLIQCLAAVHTGRLDLNAVEDIWAEASESEIRSAWVRAERGLARVLDLLTGTVRWDSMAWLPSFNPLIPLVMVLSSGKGFTLAERTLARKWLVLSNLHQLFSGSGYRDLDRIMRNLGTAPTLHRLWDLSKGKLKKVGKDDFDTSSRSGPAMSLYIAMLRNRNAKDWERGTPLDGTVVGHNAKLQVHHFFPRALLRRHEWDNDWIETFANYTVISASTNLNATMEEPATYLSRAKVGEAELDAQCIPSDRSLWRIDKYEEFISARTKLLAVRANEFLA